MAASDSGETKRFVYRSPVKRSIAPWLAKAATTSPVATKVLHLKTSSSIKYPSTSRNPTINPTTPRNYPINPTTPRHYSINPTTPRHDPINPTTPHSDSVPPRRVVVVRNANNPQNRQEPVDLGNFGKPNAGPIKPVMSNGQTSIYLIRRTTISNKP